MKRLPTVGCVAALLFAAAALSQSPLGTVAVFSPALVVKEEARNPWTHLRLNNDPDEFRFLVVSDRTGGHREKVFSRAVEQINLLQPEFVLSVGDLIEGYTPNKERIAAEWKEFQGFVGRLQMPFFYVPGNHDLTNPEMAAAWKEKFGRSYYHFVYRNVLFLVLNCEDPPNGGKGARFSPEQVEFVRQALAEAKGVRWTVVALHKPVWTHADVATNGWLDVETALADRPYTVFVGHVHRYKKYVRNNRSYYQLATTGGGSKLRGVKYGEFDHVMWVTMKKDGPVYANVMLDGVYSESLTKPETDEPVIQYNRQPVYAVKGAVYLDGTPVPFATVVFHPQDENPRRRVRADGRTEGDGSFALSTYGPFDGAPAGEYGVTVTTGGGGEEDENGGKNTLPEKYARPGTSPLKVTVKPGANEFTLELSSK